MRKAPRSASRTLSRMTRGHDVRLPAAVVPVIDYNIDHQQKVELPRTGFSGCALTFFSFSSARASSVAHSSDSLRFASSAASRPLHSRSTSSRTARSGAPRLSSYPLTTISSSRILRACSASRRSFSLSGASGGSSGRARSAASSASICVAWDSISRRAERSSCWS